MAIKDLIPFRQQHGSRTVSRRDEWNPFVRLQEEMNRLFDDFLPDTFRGAGEWTFMPEIDIKEDSGAVKRIEIQSG